MPPHVAIIVGSVVIGVGVAFVVTKHVWPHVQPQFEDFIRFAKETAQRHQRHERPYSAMPDDHEREADDEPKETASELGLSTAREIKQGVPQQPWADGLRQRPQGHATKPSLHLNEKLLDADVEMVQLDKAKSTSYAPMAPTSISQSSRGHSPSNADDNPFQEPSVPVAVAIPLPQSPEASIIADPMSRSSTLPLPQPISLASPRSTTETSLIDHHPYAHFAEEVSANSAGHTLQTPLAVKAPSLPSGSPVMSTSSLRPRNSHRATSSFSGVLSPSALPAGQTGTIRGNPAKFRAVSPSNVSDPMSGSFISAAPSKNWTDGGTADIFSGSDHGSGYHDSDNEDLRSVSDAESWEELNRSGILNSPPARRG